MKERPGFCEESQCPAWTYQCQRDVWVGANWDSPQGRKKQREHLLKQAQQDPQEFAHKCQQLI